MAPGGGVDLLDKVFFGKAKFLDPGRAGHMHRQRLVFQTGRTRVLCDRIPDRCIPQLPDPGDWLSGGLQPFSQSRSDDVADMFKLVIRFLPGHFYRLTAESALEEIAPLK